MEASRRSNSRPWSPSTGYRGAIEGSLSAEVLWQRVIRRLHVLKLAPVDWPGAQPCQSTPSSSSTPMLDSAGGGFQGARGGHVAAVKESLRFIGMKLLVPEPYAALLPPCRSRM